MQRTLDATLVGGQSTRVDQELVAYFDRRFADFKSELKSELKAELKSDLESELVPEIRAEIVRVPRSSRRRFAPRSRPARRRRDRHVDVVADRLMDEIQLVGEGVIGVDQKLDRFRGEVTEQFRLVDRRRLRLEARAIG